MTVRDWILERTQGAPPALMEAIMNAVGRELDEPESRAYDVLLNAVERALTEFLPDKAEARSGATQLLAIDALTTLAIEAACLRPDTLHECAEDAVLRLASISGGAAA